MSWDLFVQDWGNVNSLDEIPDDFNPSSIGTRKEIIERIQKAEPSVDFSDPTWGEIKNEHFSIGFNMGDKDVLHSFAMHVRGGELAIPCIGNILDQLQMRAADGSSANFFDIEKSKKDMKRWIDFKNKVLRK